MASTYSTNLRVELLANGENSTTWGSKTNVNLNLLEQAISGVASVAMTDADYTLTTSNALADEARNAVVTMTGTLTQARNVIVPSVDKQYVFKNSTTGGFSIVVKTAAGTGITVPNGETVQVYCDATNVLLAETGGATTAILVGGGVGSVPVWTAATGSGAPVRATSPTLVTPNLGTPSALVGTNITGTAAGLTAGTASAVAVGGITGLGTGVATALAANVGSAGAPVVFNGALGTPSSGVATNLTGTAAGLTAGVASAVAVGGVTGLGTNVATALGVAVGTDGAFVVKGGALGTPSSGVATNLTGTAANLVSGATNALKSATTTVNVSSATAPSSGQVLTATGASTATWQTPSVAAGIPTGTIIDFGGSAAPTGYLACDGTAVSRTTYAALFAAIGTLWGVGDGSTTFNLPNISAGYATVQTAGTVGASTTGEVKAHTHIVGSSAGAASGGFGFVAGSSGSTASASTGGADNKAAGVYVLKCIKT